MFALQRIAIPALNAFGVTAILLYLMFLLIRSDDPGLLDKVKAVEIEWPTMPEEIEVEYSTIKPPVPPRVIEQPELPKHVDKYILDIGEQVNWPKPRISGPGIGMNQPLDNPLVLAIGYPPKYPQNAIRRGIEGYVVVGFSVTSAGEVYDPFIIEADPVGVFERSALAAIAKYRYKAKTVAGEAVSASGQRYLFRYDLDN